MITIPVVPVPVRPDDVPSTRTTNLPERYNHHAREINKLLQAHKHVTSRAFNRVYRGLGQECSVVDVHEELSVIGGIISRLSFAAADVGLGVSFTDLQAVPNLVSYAEWLDGLYACCKRLWEDKVRLVELGKLAASDVPPLKDVQGIVYQ